MGIKWKSLRLKFRKISGRVFSINVLEFSPEFDKSKRALKEYCDEFREHWQCLKDARHNALTLFEYKAFQIPKWLR